jgi:hypothetical protein
MTKMGGIPEMKDKKAAIMVKAHPDLLVPPHVLDKLFQLVAGEWQPDPIEQEQLVAHFMECPYCRTALIVLLSAELEGEGPESSVRSLLTRFVALHQEIEAQEYEHMGAYAEAIVAKGREEADKSFPLLVEHIKRCPGCASTLEEILAFLNEPVESG